MINGLYVLGVLSAFLIAMMIKFEMDNKNGNR